MRKSCVLLVLNLLVFLLAISAQTIGSTYRFSTNIDKLIIGNERNASVYVIGKGSEFKFISIQEQEYYIKITKIVKIDEKALNDFKIKHSYAEIREIKEDTYKINASNLLPWMYEFVAGISHGPLSVPFRLRFDGSSTSLASGGSLGWYIGYSWQTNVLCITPLISFGLSTIPIYDININDIESKMGIYGVTGFSIKLIQKMQLCILVGVDFIGGDWQYNWKPWLSFGIGYSFTD